LNAGGGDEDLGISVRQLQTYEMGERHCISVPTRICLGRYETSRAAATSDYELAALVIDRRYAGGLWE
jgi:hypothetical protein